MKRSTAIRHLVETGEVATDLLRFRNSDIGWPLEELWVTGDLLGFAENVGAGSVVLTLDVQPEEMPWLAINASGEWAGDQLRLAKRPLLWCYRPKAWPVWNHEHRRLVRYWSATEGLHDTVIEALRVRRLEQLDIVQPSPTELEAQLQTELAVSRQHLRETIAQYWDRDWRRLHRGHDASSEDHLWRAATAVSEMHDALEDLETAENL